MTSTLCEFDTNIPSTAARSFWHPYGVPPAARRRDERVVSPFHRSVSPTRSDQPKALTRYVGGTYSPTVQVLRFSDGREARTDLIRLNPGGCAYSVDLDGVAPRSVGHYREAGWAEVPVGQAVAQEEISRILRRSYPVVDLRSLSRRLREAGYPLGSADLAAHAAIAGTQAAIWHVTNGVDLDTRPHWIPTSVVTRDALNGGPPDLRLDPKAPRWRGSVRPNRPLIIELAYDRRPQLGSVTVVMNSRSDVASLAWHLERSVDGQSWASVPTSTTLGHLRCGDGVVSPIDSRVAITTRLGAGATLADGSGAGYPLYRLVVTTEAERSGLLLEDVRFTVMGAEGYGNPESIVHLYNYLLDTGNGTTADGPVEVELVAPSALNATTKGDTHGGAVGPFLLRGLRGLSPGTRVEIGMPPESNADLVDSQGRRLADSHVVGEPFFVRHRGGRARPVQVNVSVTHPHAQTRFLVGSRTRQGPAAFTPLALAGSALATATFAFHIEAVRRPLVLVEGSA